MKKKYLPLLIVVSIVILIIVFFVVGNIEIESKQGGKQQETQHLNNFLDSFPNEDLSEGEIEALDLTLNDEYKAEAIYQKVLDKFGEVSPFNKIINAEKTHSGSLEDIYEKYDLTIPNNDWYDQVEEYDSIQEACEAGVEAEIENVALYDGLFLDVDNQDIIAVFTSLRDASRDKHLPAFQRCAAR